MVPETSSCCFVILSQVTCFLFWILSSWLTSLQCSLYLLVELRAVCPTPHRYYQYSLFCSQSQHWFAFVWGVNFVLEDLTCADAPLRVIPFSHRDTSEPPDLISESKVPRDPDGPTMTLGPWSFFFNSLFAFRRPWSIPFCALFQLAVPLSATWDFGTEARPVDQVQSDSWTRYWNLKLLIHLSTCNRNMWLNNNPWGQWVLISWSRSALWFRNV